MGWEAEIWNWFIVIITTFTESAAMILALITVGKYLEARSKGKTSEALTKLLDLAPKTAVVERGGREEEIPVNRYRQEIL